MYLDSLWILHLLGCLTVGESSWCCFKHFGHSNLTPPERRRHNIHFTLRFCRHSSHLPVAWKWPPAASSDTHQTTETMTLHTDSKSCFQTFSLSTLHCTFCRLHFFGTIIANVWPNNGHSVWLSTTTITCLCFDRVKFKKRETIVQGRLAAAFDLCNVSTSPIVWQLHCG